MAQYNSGNSLCPHLVQEYFKRVDDIIETYKSQLVTYVKYDQVGKLLLNRKIIRDEEHESINRMTSGYESKMSRTLDILHKRMWGLENLVSVLIEINVDSWLVEEIFEKYVKHIVNEIRRLQSLKNCKCFEHEKSTFIRRAVIRFFEKCDKWLFEIGTSIGFVTQTIYPTHNSLQFINNWFPITRKIDEEILPSIEYTPFEYNYPSLNGVEITEVPTDSEKSSSSSTTSSQILEVNNKSSVPSSPTFKPVKKVEGRSTTTSPSPKRLPSNSSLKSGPVKRESTVRPNPAIQTSVSPTRIPPTMRMTSTASKDFRKPEKSVQEFPGQAAEKVNKEKALVVSTESSFPSIGALLTSSASPSEDYKSSLVFLPMRLQFPVKIESNDTQSSFFPDSISNDNNNNCFVLSSIPLEQVMTSQQANTLKAIHASSSASENLRGHEDNLSILHENTVVPSISSPTVNSVGLKVSKKPPIVKLNARKSLTSQKVLSSKPIKLSQPASAKISKSILDSTSSSSEDEVFVDAQSFLEQDFSSKTDNLVNKTTTEIITTSQCDKEEEKVEKKVEETLEKSGQSVSPLTTPTEQQQPRKDATVKPEETKKISINGRLVEKRIQSSRLILGKVPKVSESTECKPIKISKPISFFSPKISSSASQSGKISSKSSSDSISSGSKSPSSERKTKSETGILKTPTKILKVNIDQEKSKSKLNNKLTSSTSEGDKDIKMKPDKGSGENELICYENDSSEEKENMKNNSSSKVSTGKIPSQAKVISQTTKILNKPSVRDSLIKSSSKPNPQEQIKTMKNLNNSTTTTIKVFSRAKTPVTVEKSKTILRSSDKIGKSKSTSLVSSSSSSPSSPGNMKTEQTIRTVKSPVIIGSESESPIKSQMEVSQINPSDQKTNPTNSSLELIQDKGEILINTNKDSIKEINPLVEDILDLVTDHPSKTVSNVVASTMTDEQFDDEKSVSVILRKWKSFPYLNKDESKSSTPSKMIQRAKSESKLDQTCPDALTLEVQNLRITLNNLTIQSLTEILNKVKEDSSSSSSSGSENSDEDDTKMHHNSDNKSSSVSDSAVLRGSDTKLLVDASSQTVLKMKAISPIPSRDKIHSTSSPRMMSSPSFPATATGTQRTVPKSEERKKTLGTTPTTTTIGNNRISSNLAQKTTSTSSPTINKMVEKVTKVSPTKPAWSNKKVLVPSVSTDRFTFSVEDYNFQLWANEWASRQEKKKMTEEGQINTN